MSNLFETWMASLVLTILNNPNVISGLLLLAVAILDRWVIRKGAVYLIDVVSGKTNANYVRFILSYCSNQCFINSEISYTVRDKEEPATVIYGKSGTLDFSRVGQNVEYLLIDKKLLRNGTWIVDVKITTTGSRLNPLHKIFPITTHLQREVRIKL
jgi:hypothetical protein